jgi:hypothetical protein
MGRLEDGMKPELTMLERATDAVESAYDKAMGWDFEEIARAVIASLREPSEHMKRVGARSLYTLPLVDHELEETADAWRLMVDAILEEPKA